MTADAAIALATPIAVIIAAVLQQLSAIKARKASTVKLEAVAKTTEEIHTLVNSSMSAALKTSFFALRRVADLTKHQDDIAAWQIAEKAYREHEAKQRVVDGNVGKPAAL